jgi:two-component system cell cycle sensor histidine kinase/response regulator CckA
MMMPTSDPPPEDTKPPRAEVAQSDHEELFRLLTEHVLDFIRLHDLDGRSVYASRSVERLYGEVPTTLFQFAHPDDAAACDAWWRDVVAGVTKRLRWRVCDGDGNWRWLETAATVVRFQGREHVLTVCRDVTEQMQTEHVVRDSERRLKEAERLTHVGFWENDLESGRITWSDETGRIAGVPPGQGAPSLAEYHEMIHPEDRAVQAAALARAERGEAPYDLEYRLVRRDGEVRYLHSVGEVVRDAAGRPRRAFGAIQDITDRKLAEMALRESERQLNEAQRLAHVGYWENDFDANRVSWSEETRRILGLPADECDRTPERLGELVHPEDRPIFADAFARALRGESDFPVEFRIVRPKGDVRHVQTIVDVVRDATGRPRRAFGAVQDVTDRTQAEQARRQSERRLNEAQRIAHLGHWEEDLENGRISASDETYRIFGLPPQEDLRNWAAWQEHVHPDDRSVRAAAIERALGDGPRYDVEYRIVRPDGDIRVVKSQGEVERDHVGQPLRLFGILQDVTEQRRAEAARRAAEHRLEHVVASSPAILFSLHITDGQFGGIDWMSDNVDGLLGYRVEETLGRDWWLNNIHVEERDSVVQQFIAEILSRGHSAAEYRFRHADGKLRWLRGETRLVRDAAGQPGEVVGSLSDITERKGLENQFRQAQKMEAIGHLAGGIAHDFNNLLTVMGGYSDMLLAELPPEDSNREMVGEIRQAADRAAALTRQLLAFSRRTVLEPRVVDLNELVRDHEKMLRRLIGEDVQLTTDLEVALDRVKVDPGQLGQVIMNLAVNARDAMPTGGRLRIETRSVAPNDVAAEALPEATSGLYILLAITDTGVGITPDVRAHLFEPFFTTKQPGKGTGLGLATVYGIVKQSGGFIAVDSEPGRGTAFKIYFPAVTDAISTDPSPSGRRSRAVGAETILLVEDEDAVRSMINVVLRRAGYTVLETGRSSEAIRLAGEQRRIDLLITDVVMPEMGGRELVEQVARVRPAIKVLYLSGYTDDAVVRHGVLQAEVAFLQKPFAMAALTNKVRQVLDE